MSPELDPKTQSRTVADLTLLGLGARRAVPGLVAGLTLLGFAAHARANDDVVRGVERYRQADFQGALASFHVAEEEGPLDRGSLVRLLEMRALVHHASGDDESMRADLVRLASLSPDHELTREAPPEVRAAFASVRERIDGRLDLESRAVLDGENTRIEIDVKGDEGALVRGVRVFARATDKGEFQSFEGREVTVPIGRADRLHYYAEAIGPGRAVLASEASPEEPRVIERVEPPTGTTAPSVGASGSRDRSHKVDLRGPRRPADPPLGSEESDSGPGIWLYAGIGAALLLAGALLAVLLVDPVSDVTQPNGPRLVVP